MLLAMNDRGPGSYPSDWLTQSEADRFEAIVDSPDATDEQLLELLAWRNEGVTGAILMRGSLSVRVLQAIIDTDPTAEDWAHTHKSAPPAWKETQPIGQISSPSIEAYVRDSQPPPHVAAAIYTAHDLTNDPAVPLLGDVVRAARAADGDR